MNQTHATDRSAATTPDRIAEAGTTTALADELAATRASLEERFADLAVLGTEIARLEAELDAKNAEIAALAVQVKHSPAGALKPEHAELTIGELARQLELRDRTIAEVASDRDRAVLMVEDIFGSTSWKVTAPLRKLKEMLRRPDRS